MDKRASDTAEIERSMSLTGYPLAQHFEWAPAADQQISFEHNESEGEAMKHWWERP